VLLPFASPPFPPLIAPGGNAFSSAEPAFISEYGGIPPLSTGASLPEDWANADIEPADNTPIIVRAVNFDLIMVYLL
jgi:hypothetical protein